MLLTMDDQVLDMNYGLISNPALKQNECLVIGIIADAPFPVEQFFPQENQDLAVRLSSKIHKAGEQIGQAELSGQSVLFIHCGTKEQYHAANLKKRLSETIDNLLKQRITSATLCFPKLSSHSPDHQLEQMIVQVSLQTYQMLDFKSTHKKPSLLTNIDFYLPESSEQALKNGISIAAGIKLTRDLANLPANICTPTYLGEQAEALAAEYNSTVHSKVYGVQEIQDMGMNTLLAVAQGSSQPPRLIDIQYRGAGDAAPIILVGKGITFDSGGMSIKPANAMDEMKYDMCGAASVLGVIKACAELKLPINITGIIPSCENMINGEAVKPGDIVTTLSGQTVEILNTDAEGRLILADALTYAERYNPRFVIDVATLTGGVIIALGTVASGLMTQDEELADLIMRASKESGDKVWRLPLDEEYQEALESPLADMINASFDRSASSVTAACFLSRFTEKFRWAHLDIAGVAWVFGKKRNATGRPVPLLIQLIRDALSTH